MKKTNNNSGLKVKKTLVRNCEQKVRQADQPRVVHETRSQGSIPESAKAELSQPSLCSSVALANYLKDVKKSLPPPLSAEDVNAEKDQFSSKVTKKLNFHITDKIYKNLIELNTTIEETKTKRERRPTSSTKRDLEPNIEDFYQDEIDVDTPPEVPVIKPRFRQLRKVEDGQLHKLVASFDKL